MANLQLGLFTLPAFPLLEILINNWNLFPHSKPLVRQSHKTCSERNCNRRVSDYGHELCFDCAIEYPETDEYQYHLPIYIRYTRELFQYIIINMAHINTNDNMDININPFTFSSRRIEYFNNQITNRFGLAPPALFRQSHKTCSEQNCDRCVSQYSHELCFYCASTHPASDEHRYHIQGFIRHITNLLNYIIYCM